MKLRYLKLYFFSLFVVLISMLPVVDSLAAKNPTTPSSPSPSNGATNVAVSGTLSWSCSANDGGSTLSYDLYMGTTTNNMKLYKSGSGKSCSYSGLSAGQTYYWKVVVYNGSGGSTQGAKWNFTTKAAAAAAPTTPSSPSPSNGATNVAVSGTLSWSSSPNDGGSTLSYDLYMGTSTSNMKLYKSGSGKSCSYSGLSAGQKYYWKVIVYNGSGKSTQSSTWNFTTKAAAAPTTPSSPSPSNGATNVAVSGTLSWSCSANDGGSTLSYDLYMGTSTSNMKLYKSGSGKSCSYSGLSAGQKYYWKVIVYNGSGKSTQSSTWNFTTKAAAAPTTPSSPSPSNGATNVAVSGTLSWSCSANDGGSTLSYDLYMGTSSSNMKLYKSGSGKSCSYSGLSAGQKYYWKVIVYNGSGKSTQSSTWSFTTKATPAPTTPSSPSPSDGATNVAVSGTLSWSCSANDGGSTLSYDLYMGTSSSSMKLYKSGSGKSCSYSGLSAGQKYYWKVIAYNGSGKSTQSSTWSFTTKAVAAPTTPTSPSPSDGATNVAVSGTLSWSCSPNDGGSTLSYDLYMGTSSSSMKLYTSGQGKSCSYSGLSAGQKYYWKVIVYNGSGKSTQSSTWSFTTKAVAAPTTPTSPSPSDGATNVAVSGTLSWSCSPNDGGSTLSYDLYMGTSSSNMKLYQSGQGKSCSYSGLSAGQKYYWKVIAYNGSGKSTQSSTWSFTTKAVAAPTTPTSPSPSDGATNVAVSGTLSWSCSPNDGGSTLSYDLYMGTSSSDMKLYKSGQGTSCAYSGLSNGKKYYWKLIAYNGSGKSTQSPTWSFTTKDSPTVSAPTTPSSPSPSSGAQNVGTSGTLKWSCSPNDGGSTLSYDLYIGTSANNMVLYKSGQGTSCSYSLAANTTYYWKLIAYNGSGKSTQSPTWSFSTKASTVNAPTTPSSPSPSSGAMNVGTSGTLKWSCSPNDGGSTLSYDLYMGTSTSNMKLYKSGSGTSCNYSGLSGGTRYYWKLIAYNGSGKSTQSPIWNFTTTSGSATTTLAIPSSSTFKVSNITETGFTASWGAVSGAKYYDIKVRTESGTYDQPAFSQATASTTVNVTGLKSGTSYKFRVRARNGNHDQNSEWSAEISTSVKTKSQGTAPAFITIYAVKGFNESTSFIAGHTQHFEISLTNSGTSAWKGSIYLKEGDKDLKGWANISLANSNKSATTLKYDYTPTSSGTKTLTLYYQTDGIGGGLPVYSGNGKNPITIKVKDDGTINNNLKLLNAITAPTTLEFKKRGSVAATVVNKGTTSWTGTLYLTDNGKNLDQKTLTLGVNQQTTLTNAAWQPETTGSHAIGVYYLTENGSSQQLVNANNFTNPVTVVVSNADVLGDASKVVIKHITASVEPKEVTPGTVVMYHYKLLDENGKQLRNMKLRFKYTKNNETKYIDSEPSDLEGYATLYISTSGNDAIAGRGQTANLECVQAINENNKVIPISASDTEKKISLKIHQGTSFSRDTGFENVESTKITITPGVTARMSGNISNLTYLGDKAKGKASLKFPIGVSFKWDDAGYVNSYTIGIGVNLSASGGTSKKEENLSKMEKFIPSFSGSVACGYNVNFTTDAKDAIIRFVRGWVDNYTEGTNWKTDLAVKAMRMWFDDLKQAEISKSFYYSFGANMSGNVFTNWPGDYDFKQARTPVMRVEELNLSGSGNVTIEPWKTKGNNLEGYSSAVKLGGSFELKGKVDNLIRVAKAKIQGRPLIEAYFEDVFDQNFFYADSKLKYSKDFSMKHDEMYNKGTKAIEQVSQQMSLSTSWDFSTEEMRFGEYLPEGMHLFDVSVGYTNKYTSKVTSKGEWARFLHRQVISDSEYKNDVLKVFPNLSYQTYFAPPLNIYRSWSTSSESQLARLASIVPNPNLYSLSDAMKYEYTVSSEFDASVNIKIYDWGWCNFYIDTDLSLELENKPNVSYFSVPDRRRFDIVLRPTTSVKKVASSAIKHLGQKIVQTFEEEHPNIVKAWEWMKQAYNMVVDEAGNVVEMVDNAIGDEVEDAFYLFWYHWYMHDRYNANTQRAMRKHPLLAAKEQTDICKFALGINKNKEERNFNPGVKIEVPHYYPAGDLLGITEQGDTLFVVSEVIDIIATQGADTLRTTQAGQFQMETTIGVDDLTPFGFPEDTPLDVYHAEEGSKIWSYVGPAGSTLMTDKLGAYMIATSLKNDVITPEILADYDETYGVIHLNIKDNIGVRMGSLSITINGEEKDFSMISESSIDVYLTDEEMQHMLTLYVTVNDLAGNSGTLFQMYNLDMPTIIEDVKTEDDKTTVQFKDRLMKVEGAQANATICVFSINGELVVKTKANEQGCANVQLSAVPDGLYVFTISNGKSGKILVK